jgi:uncharacterized membrane protein YjjP (DUF1212 family)
VEDLASIGTTGARVGEMLLASGAETHRAEETMNRACRAAGAIDVEGYVTPTGLFLGVKDAQGHAVVEIRRVQRRGVDLARVVEVNNLVRHLERGKLDLGQVAAKLAALAAAPPAYGNNWPVLAGAVGAAVSVLFLGGTVRDMPLALGAALLVRLVVRALSRLDGFYFLAEFLGGFAAGVGVVALRTAGISFHAPAVLVASILSLVPGTVVTAAIRDFITGDMVSGVVRGAEAALLAVALASGVAASMSLTAIVPR